MSVQYATPRPASAAAVPRALSAHVILPAAVRAEFQKSRRSAALRSAVIAPFVLAVLALVLSLLSTAGELDVVAHNFCLNVWNWWYALFLPGMVGVAASSSMQLDARLGMRAVLGMPGSPALVFGAKAVFGVAMIALSTLVVALAAVVVPLLLGGVGTPLPDALLAALLITLTSAWLVPLSLGLTARLGMLAGFAITFMGDMAVGIFGWQMGLVGAVLPSSLRMLAMVPVLGIMPNGLPYDATSPYAAFVSTSLGTYAPGIVVSVVLCAVLAAAAAGSFAKREAR